MSAAPSSACIEPSRNVISACTTDCGCTSTSSASGGKAEEMMRLDQLEALVHERRRIDGDLGAHRPGRVRDRLLRRRLRDALRRPGAERPARGGQRVGADVRRVAPVDELVERVVLGIDRQHAHLVLRARAP